VTSDTTFNTIVYSATVAGTSHLATTPLMSNTTYYWRVTPQNMCGNGTSSAIFSFKTLSPICRMSNLSIPDFDVVTDTMTLSNSGIITHLNVSISATHTWVGDLSFVLQHADTGTSVTIIDRPGGAGCGGDDIDVMLDNNATESVQATCPTTVPALSGILSPTNSLNVFEGEDLNGTWYLVALDNSLVSTGTLVEWCLHPALNFSTYLPVVLKN
jgi:subtilisin-like proprotein convertase family protein